MKIDRESFLIKLSLLIYALFVFSRNSIGMAIPMIVWFAAVGISILLMMLVCIRRFRWVLPYDFVGPLYVALIGLLYNNQDFLHSTFVDYFVVLIPIFFSIVLKDYNGWHTFFLKILIIESAFYTFWTIISAIDANVYDSFIFPFLKRYQPGLGRGNFTCGFTTHYSTNGMYIALGTLAQMARVLAYRDRRIRIRLFDILLLLYLLSGLLLCGKRGIILCVVMSFCTVYLFAKPRLDRPAKLLLLLFVGCLFVYIGSLWLPALLVFVERFQSQISSGDILTGRLDIWKEGWEAFLSSPLLGHGWGWFRYNNSIGAEFHVHNCYLQWLCELGIVFSLPIFWFIFSSFYKVFKAFRTTIVLNTELSAEEAARMTFVLMYFIYFLFFMLEGTAFYEMQCVLPFYLNIAICYNLTRKTKKLPVQTSGRKRV